MTISRRDLNIPLSDTMHHVLRKLGDEGHKALVVGGAVRDAMLGEEPKDIDVEVYGTHYDHLSKTLSQHGKVNLVGKAFGVVKFTDPDGNDYDFSLPRRDNKTGVGHKDFSTDFDPDITPKEAASRRDFTFNSMAYDPEKGELHDYFHGEEDLKNKVIRHTSDAFSEDPLRVLRGMQFSARFGMHLHPDTAKECQRISDQYDSIPKERVGEEFMKLATKGKHPGAAIDYLKESGWSKNFPAIHALHGVPQDSGYHPEGDVATHTAHSMDAAAKIADREGLKGDDRATIVFGAMCHDMGKPSTTKEWPYGYREVEPPTRETEWEENGGWRRPTVTSHGHDEVGEPIARQFLSDINVKPDIADKVAPLVREHMQHVNFTTGVSSRTVRRLAQRVAPASIKELGHVMEADNSGRPPHAPNLPVGAKNMLDKAEESHVTEKPMEKFIQGRDVLPYFPDVKPGPHIGETVKAAYEAQLNGEINSPEEGQEWLKKRFNKTSAVWSNKEAPQCSICEGRTSVGEWGEEHSCRKCKGTGYAPHPFSTEGVYGSALRQGVGFGDPRFDRDKDNPNMCGACGYDEGHEYLHHPDHGFPRKVLHGDPRLGGDIRTQIDLDAYDHRKCLYCHKDGHHYTECPEKPWEGQNWWGDGVENPAQPIGWAQKTARKYRDFTSAPVAYQVKHIEQVHDANANGYVANDLGGWDVYHAMLHRDEDFRSVLGYGIGHNTADNPHEHAGTFPLGPTDPRFRAAPDSGLDKYYKKGQVAHPDVFPLDKCMFIRQLKDPYDPRGRRITCNKPPVAWVAFKGGRGPDKGFYDTPKSWGGLCKDHVDVFGGSGKLWERTTQKPKVVQSGDPRYHRLGSNGRCYYYSDHQNDPRQENGGENPCIRPVAGYTTNQYGDRRAACRIHGERMAERGDKWEPFKTSAFRNVNDPRGHECGRCGQPVEWLHRGDRKLWIHSDRPFNLKDVYETAAPCNPLKASSPLAYPKGLPGMTAGLARDINDPRGQACVNCGESIQNNSGGLWTHTDTHRTLCYMDGAREAPMPPQQSGGGYHSAWPNTSRPRPKKHASWADVRNKAVRMRNSGRVHIIQMSTDVVVADVDGDHATYRTELWRQFPGQKNITLWDCTCDWNTYAWGTTGPRRKFEGRMCSHALAVLYETLGKERKRSKTAHKLHYHVAPSAARESISRNGIDASKGDPMWGAGGNYLFKNKSDARTYINEALPRIQRSQDWDMWQVDTSGLKLEPDEEDEMAREFTDEGARHDYAHKELQGYQHITGDPIEPARLQLLDTLTSPKNQQEWEEAHDRGEHAPITHADFSVRRYQEAGPRLENCSRCKQQWFKGARNASIDSSSELDRCSQTIWRKVEYGDPRYDRSNVPMINGTPLLNAQESRDWVKRFNTPLPRPCGKPAVEWHSPGRDEWFAKCAEHATGRPIPDPDKQWLHTTEKPTPGKTAGMADPDLHPRDWNDPRGPVKDTCHNCGGEIHLKENPAGEPDWYHLRSDGHTLSLYCGVDMSQGLRLAEPKTAHRMRRPDDPRGPTTTECKNCGQPLHLSPHPRTGELDWYHKVSDPGVTEYYSMYCDQDLRRSVAEPKTAGRDPNDPRGEECGNCGEELKWHEPTGQWIHQGRDLNWAAAVCIIDGKQGEWSYGKPPVMVKPKHGMVFNPPKKYYKADWSELPDKVYHVAPRSARESIEREGLDSTGRTHNFVQDTMGWSGDYYQHGPKTPEWNKAYHYRPEAVYAIASPAAAAETVRAFNERRGEPHDAWEIDTDSLRAHQNQPEHKTDVIRDPELLQDSWESEKNEPKEYRSYDSPEEAWETFKESPIGPNQEEDDARSWAFEKVHREHIRRVPTYQMKDPDDWDEDDHEELREHNPALHKEYFGDEDEDWEKEGKMAAVSFGGDPRLDQWQDYTDDPYCKRGEPHNPTAVTRVRTIPVSTEKLHSFLGLDTPGLIRSRYNGKYRGDEWDKKIKDVSDNGILEPLTIAVNDSTDASHPHVSVIDGTHRIAWAHELGMPTVPCEVRYFGDGVHHDPFEKPIKTAGSGGKLVFSPRGSRPVTLDVEIAEDARSIKQGLMNRPSMPLNHGMVFLSPNPPARSGFWMMSTLIPLTLITWDRTGRVLEIIDMEPCRSGSNCPVYTPRTPYWGAVEVNQGYAASYRITPGDRVELRR